MTDPKATEIDRVEKLIVERLQRYAKRTSARQQPGLLKADKVISIIRERFDYIRSGTLPNHDHGKGERANLKKGATT
jgi:hypothetical protein